MPYIPQEDRSRLEAPLQALFDVMTENKGEYVYLVFRIARYWLDLRGGHSLGGSGLKLPYLSRSNAVSILADAHHEFRRQYLDLYEDHKRKENGGI